MAWLVLSGATPWSQSCADDTVIVEHHADEILIRNQSASEFTVTAAIILPPAAADPDSRLPFSALVLQAAQMTSVDPALIHAMIAVESGYNSEAISHRGARGLMQLMPGTARQLGVNNPHDPAQSIVAGARHLEKLLQIFNQDLTLALAAYNAGAGAVERHGRNIPPYAKTKTYISRVLARYRRLQARRM